MLVSTSSQQSLRQVRQYNMLSLRRSCHLTICDVSWCGAVSSVGVSKGNDGEGSLSLLVSLADVTGKSM